MLDNLDYIPILIGRKGKQDRFIVVGAVERKGSVVTRVINDVRANTLEAFVKQTCQADVSLLATDDHQGYAGLKYSGWKQGAIAHSRRKYVVGAIHD